MAELAAGVVSSAPANGDSGTRLADDDARPHSPPGTAAAGAHDLLADRLRGLQLAHEHPTAHDHTQPHPLPIASTSSSPPPSQPARTDAFDDSPQKRRLVLLKRPPSPPGTGNPGQDQDPSHEQSARPDAIEARQDDERRARAEAAATSAHESAAAHESGAEPASTALDPVIHGALNHARDRLLLLRAEVELERFVLNTSMTRLPLAPPHFQPGLNSYQRLLIHRLADMFGITREVEPAPPTLWNAGMINPATGQPQGVVVLVKGEGVAIPSKKLASYVPAPESSPAASSPIQHLPIARQTSSLSSPAASPDDAGSPASVGVAAAAAPPQPVFKILPRASRETSSASSSADVDDDGSSSLSANTGVRSKLRRDLTLEEREAAYKEARERIFSQPDPVERPTPAPSTSAASSVAGEDAASVQSLGYGITRPSSAGSTFSRSSAALSVSGQRPPPSIASDSNANMPFFGYYQQQQALPHPHSMAGAGAYPVPTLRPPAPIFDPASGGWTYTPTSEYTQAHPYVSNYGSMPPPPPPPPMPYPGQSPSDLPVESATTPSAWHRSLPSPALSGSSNSSFPPPTYQHLGSATQPSPGAGGGAPSPSSADPGYLMRFPEGAIVTAAGAVVGPPQPYAAVAIGAGLRSSSAASIGASSSASRVATRGGTSSGPSSLRRLSQSTTQSLGSLHSSSAPLSDDAASPGSPSTSNGGGDDSPDASLAGENYSEVGSSVGGGSSSAPPSVAGAVPAYGRRGRQTTIVSRTGRPDRERERVREEERDGSEGASPEEGRMRESSPLHPSLPAKPTWAAAAAGSATTPERAQPVRTDLVATSPSTGRPVSAAQPASLRDLPGLATVSRSPPPAASSPGGIAFPPLSGAGGSRSMSLAPPPPPGPGPWSRTVPQYQPQSQQHYAPPPPPPGPMHPNGYAQYGMPGDGTGPGGPPPPPPSSYATWLAQAAVGPPAPPNTGFSYAPRQAPPASHLYGPLSGPSAGGRAAPAASAAAAGTADLMTMPDMRRPPPRSTQLFDPNKPANAGGMRRVASGAGGARSRS